MYPSFAIVKFHQKNENEETKKLIACYLKFTIDNLFTSRPFLNMEYLKIKWINKPTVKNTNKSLPKQTNLKTNEQKHRKKENTKNKYLNYFSNEKEQSHDEWTQGGREGGWNILGKKSGMRECRVNDKVYVG